MKKSINLYLICTLLFIVGCSNQTKENSNKSSKTEQFEKVEKTNEDKLSNIYLTNLDFYTRSKAHKDAIRHQSLLVDRDSLVSIFKHPIYKLKHTKSIKEKYGYFSYYKDGIGKDFVLYDSGKEIFELINSEEIKKTTNSTIRLHIDEPLKLYSIIENKSREFKLNNEKYPIVTLNKQETTDVTTVMLESTIEEIEQKLIDNQTPATFEYTTLTIKDLTPTVLSIEMEVFFKQPDGHSIHIDIAYSEDLDSSEPVVADKFLEEVNKR